MCALPVRKREEREEKRSTVERQRKAKRRQMKEEVFASRNQSQGLEEEAGNDFP